ncbi:STAS domain-containing protein [Streptomyces polyrhachis]|uniref:Anti-sigma factor antagonist n=1 Tax=Streptomyces polyrhachis TaxID=1282885 RepID=A0ABW2GCK0_9ACTN
MTTSDPFPTLRTQVHEAYTLVVLGGELDAFAAGRLRPELDTLTAPGADGPPGLVLDLRRVTFADCGGLSLLVRARRRARGRGGDVTLVCDSPRVLRVLRLTRLDREFTVRADRAGRSGTAQLSGSR